MRKKLYIAVILLIVAAVAAGLLIMARTGINQEQALSTVLEWARLASLPASAEVRSIATQGSSFSREFQMELAMPATDMRQWLEASPGAKEAAAITLEDGSIRYRNIPGGGAQFAELVLSPEKDCARVRVYWS